MQDADCTVQECKKRIQSLPQVQNLEQLPPEKVDAGDNGNIKCGKQYNTNCKPQRGRKGPFLKPVINQVPPDKWVHIADVYGKRSRRDKTDQLSRKFANAHSGKQRKVAHGRNQIKGEGVVIQIPK